MFQITYRFIRPNETKVTTFVETRETKELAFARWDHSRWVMERKGYKYLGGEVRYISKEVTC